MPELDASVAVRILKDRYGVFIEPVIGKPYYIRFRQLSTDRTLQGMTHAKGTKLSPRFLLQIIERFGITLPDFLEGLSALQEGPQRL